MTQNKIILKNALPLSIVNKLRKEFLNSDYDKITQERRTLFKREFSNSPAEFPSEEELYTSEFYRSKFLENSDFVQNCFKDYIKPILVKNIDEPINNVDLRAYKMLPGGHFRMHKDDYISNFGFILYLNKMWKWDWGGLLIDIENNNPQITLPEFNKIVIMNHKNGLTPHFVTTIEKHALEPRLMLVGFLS